MANKELEDILRTQNELGKKLEGVEGILAEHLPWIVQHLRQKVNIEEMLVANGAIDKVGLDKLAFGNVTIDEVVIGNTNATMSTEQTYLQNVDMIVTIHFDLEWWYDFWFDSDSGTMDLGSLGFLVPVGNVEVPDMDEVQMNIPTMNMGQISAAIPDITNMDLGAMRMEGIRAIKTQLPADGFVLSGMSMKGLKLDSMSVPKTETERAGVDVVAPDSEVRLPHVEMSGIPIPTTQIPSLSSGGFGMNAVADSRSISVSFGSVFGFRFVVRPSVDMHIDAMHMNQVTLSGEIGSVRLQDIRMPMTMNGVNLEGLTMENIEVKTLEV